MSKEREGGRERKDNHEDASEASQKPKTLIYFGSADDPEFEEEDAGSHTA